MVHSTQGTQAIPHSDQEFYLFFMDYNPDSSLSSFPFFLIPTLSEQKTKDNHTPRSFWLQQKIR